MLLSLILYQQHGTVFRIVLLSLTLGQHGPVFRAWLSLMSYQHQTVFFHNGYISMRVFRIYSVVDIDVISTRHGVQSDVAVPDVMSTWVRVHCPSHWLNTGTVSISVVYSLRTGISAISTDVI